MRTKYFLTVCFSLLMMSSWCQSTKVDSLISVLERTKNDIDKAKLLNTIADTYKSSNPKLMLQYANEALTLSKKINFTTAEGNALLNLGNVNIISGDYAKALNFFAEAQHLFETISEREKLENKQGLAKALGSIGIVFSEQSNYGKALQYYLKSVKIYEEIKDEEKCAKLYNNIGVVYQLDILI
ncbi:tetratricopeptide repeat protein [Flavobacterium macrobrachii]|uniref:Tetratricopeptide repeat protein n=1 Tax=Flavobacterium macrobrachii TaxID=591204 RepID=A0ABS2CTD5_9FLAO|nr:tetratricopeptide repeat protein [Flavobacterium macrobrachii]MBM6498195.1 tetratricopeptide repeat protein [Flavobacterium macrobrachii]